jgi:hypothetical protein
VNISPEGVPPSSQQHEDEAARAAAGGFAGLEDEDEEIRPGSFIKGGLKLAERISNNITNARKSQNLPGTYSDYTHPC